MNCMDNGVALLQSTILYIDGVAMPTITEKELLNYLSLSSAVAKDAGGKKMKKGIDAFVIEEFEPGKFMLVMDLTYREKGTVMITARKTPRIWPKLDTVPEYIKSLGFSRVPISLKLLEPGTENETSSTKNSEDDS